MATLRDFLSGAGITGDTLTRTLELLAGEDITSVALLTASWLDVRDSLKLGPRNAIESALVLAESEVPTTHDPGSSDAGKPGIVAPGLAVQLMTKLLANQKCAFNMRESRRHISARFNSALLSYRRTREEEVDGKPWALGSSSAEYVPMEMSQEGCGSSESSRNLSKDFAQRLDVYEWRAKGFAYHSVPVKELVEWFNDHVGEQSAEEVEVESAVTARDLRKCDPNLNFRASGSSSQQKPFLAVRRGAVLIAVAELRISICVMRGRALLFSGFSEKHRRDTEETIWRLEQSRVAGYGGWNALAGAPELHRAFGFQALDATLQEINWQLHIRTEALVRRSLDSSREAARRDDDADEDTEAARGDMLRKSTVRLQTMSACADAIEDVLKDALEQQVTAIERR